MDKYKRGVWEGMTRRQQDRQLPQLLRPESLLSALLITVLMCPHYKEVGYPCVYNGHKPKCPDYTGCPDFRVSGAFMGSSGLYVCLYLGGVNFVSA